MPTLNEIYADLVKWGMPEIERLEFQGGKPLLFCAFGASPAYIDDKIAEAILTQHALEGLAEKCESIPMGEGVGYEGASWLTLSIEPSYPQGWCLVRSYFGGGEDGLGSGATLLLAIWDAWKQLGSEG